MVSNPRLSIQPPGDQGTGVDVGQGVYVAGTGEAPVGAAGVGDNKLSSSVISTVGDGKIGVTTVFIRVGSLIPEVSPGNIIGRSESDSLK
jgi:hypothetical protein